MRLRVASFALVLLALVCGGSALAHVGSPNVYFAGTAGSHELRAVIRPPSAIPGRAEITITLEGDAVQSVTVLPSPAGLTEDALPPATRATRVAGTSDLYSAELWLMQLGPHAIRIKVYDAGGVGEAVVPLNAVNRAPEPSSAGFVLVLGVLVGLLALGAVAIVGALVRHVGLARAEAPSPARRRAANLAAAATALGVLGLLVSTWSSWQRMDRAYRGNQIFAPLPVEARAENIESDRLLLLSPLPRPGDPSGRKVWPALLTDHGKLVHMFLLREPALDAFAHIHPVLTPANDFAVAIPTLPEGRYRVYADITQEDGLSQTLTTEVDVPPMPGSGAPRVIPDPDDSYRLSEPFDGELAQTTRTSELLQGYVMHWENPEAADGVGVAALQFAVNDASGAPAALEPYMGMLAHAAVRREDGAVFSHLHPIGSISMASQMAFGGGQGMDHDMAAMGESSSSASGGMDHAHHGAPPQNRVEMPYEFPEPGPYRIWVQVKIDGTVMTGIFDAKVSAGR